MIRLVVSDLDGTLLNDEHIVSKENKKAINELENKDIKFCIATGRLNASAKVIARELGGSYNIISCNGALIKSADGSERIYINSLKNNKAIAIAELLESMNQRYHFYTEDSVYSKTLSNSALCYHEQNLKNNDNKEDIRIVICEDIVKKAGIVQDILKFIVFFEDENDSQEIMNKLIEIEGIDISQSGTKNLEIMNKNVSKGNAIKIVSDMYKIPTSEIMVLGDQKNDLSMFEIAGLKVAMANGNSRLKTAADFITKSNNDSGVAYAINKVIFERESE
ncbi:MAG: Cof-type HAD-IIB family hydrolase [Proteocatella sp.]